MVITLIVLGIVVVLVFYVISLYNNLVKLRNRIENAWAQIDVQLKRRWDLIPNLVETVKGYASHERETLEAVIAARNAATTASGPQESAGAENMLTGALRQLFAVSEAYPDLKANTNFLELQEELTGTEGRIAYARQHYNDQVLKYNTAIETFPAVVIAGMMRFTEREYFEAEGDERGNVGRVLADRSPVRAHRVVPRARSDSCGTARPVRGDCPGRGRPPRRRVRLRCCRRRCALLLGAQRRRRPALRALGAFPLDEGSEPRLESLVESICASHGIAEPILYVVESSAIDAAVVGKPDDTHLIVTAVCLRSSSGWRSKRSSPAR